MGLETPSCHPCTPWLCGLPAGVAADTRRSNERQGCSDVCGGSRQIRDVGLMGDTAVVFTEDEQTWRESDGFEVDGKRAALVITVVTRALEGTV